MAISIAFKTGSIFKSEADMLINPVNTVGVMGAGLAKQFKTKYPKNFKHYYEYCKSVRVFNDFRHCVFTEKSKIIYNLPTKENFSEFSSLGKVRRSLINLVNYLNKNPVEKLAIPPIGAGLGGLGMMNVLHLILYHLRRVEYPLSVELYGFTDVKPTIKMHILKHYDFEYREQDKYCGVGSRETDSAGEELIRFLAIELNYHGYTLSTGDAIKGADLFFWSAIKGQKFRFGPDGRKARPETIVVPNDSPTYSVATKIVEPTHPAWRWLPDWMKELHIRNVFQVLGSQLNEPCEFVLCWTKDAAEVASNTSKQTGGTGTAIRVADRFGVPVFNLKDETALIRLSEFLGIDYVNQYAKQRGNL